jgi:TatD DNase family protein
MVNIGADWQSSLMSLRLAEKYRQIYATAGFHPNYAASFDDEKEEKIYALAREKRVVAIGEIGLDYYHNAAPKEKQAEVFRRQIKIARQLKKPVVIHDREAHGDCLRIIAEEKAGENGGIMHCFSGSWEMAKKLISLGFYISFAGPLTYVNASSLRETAKNIPAEYMLVETDAPYLSPHPYRGKINEPCRVVLTAEKIAALKGMEYEEAAKILTANAKRVYGIEREEM